MSRRRLRVLAAIVALTALAGGTAYAASLTAISSTKLTDWHSAAGCTPQTLTLSASDDATIDETSPSTNFGSSTDLKVRASLLNLLGTDLLSKRYTLVRFTLPSLQLCTVTLAKLRLYATSTSSGRSLQAQLIGLPWAEGTVTWNTSLAPTATGAVTISSGAGTTGYYEWTVTGLVTAMYPPGNNYGFLVRDTGALSLLSPEQIYNSDEAASNKPQLVVTYG